MAILDIVFIRDFRCRLPVSDQWDIYLPVSAHGFIHDTHSCLRGFDPEDGTGDNIDTTWNSHSNNCDGKGNGFRHGYGEVYAGGGRDIMSAYKTGFLDGRERYT
jgi:hypothetical protein